MNKARGAVIVGAGVAGVSVAKGLRSRGFEGPITLVNAEPCIPYDRPPLSKELLSGDRSRDEIVLHPASFYDDLGVALLSGRRVLDIDRAHRQLRMERGETLAYDHLVMATGARPRPLPCAVTGDQTLSRMFYLRDLDDAMALRARLTGAARLLVVGAGFIGLEVAASARRMGCRVTVLEAGQRVLERAAPERISAFVQSLHRENGVEFRFDAQVDQIREDAQSISVWLRRGETFSADLVLVGIGAVPNEEIARAAGLHCDGGIVVDAQCRTADPHVYAVGDVAKAFSPLRERHVRLEHWDSALHTGDVAAATICGEPAANDGVPWVWSDQHGVNLQFLGWSDPRAERVLRGEPGGAAWGVIEVLEGRVIGAALVNAGRDRRPLQRLVRSGIPVDVARLADSGVALKQWAA